MRSQQYNEANDKATEMNTLTACVNKVVKDGYIDSFKVTSRGLYSCSTDKYFAPGQVKIVNFYRFEGESDPADMSILYVIESASGEKGTLVDAYGPYADENVSKFMREIEEVNKKEVHSDSAQKEEQKPDIK
ncbi:hypothetical protein [Polluticoccus soli]|uniref:hypothetical protein n=1 Tax=Polluticoccus soli TaxID=3034150 RepID=UPI0023E1A936|nr:hypothetical protein [Flavipsychrobacter sp. JY13-12]